MRALTAWLLSLLTTARFMNQGDQRKPGVDRLRVARLGSFAAHTSIIAVYLSGLTQAGQAAEFDEFLKPLLTARCVKCHGSEAARGKINFQALGSAEQLLAQPELIQRVLEAIDTNDMPPDNEPPLAAQDRSRLLAALKALLRQSSSRTERQPTPLHRLNRFQYNNAVRDLFQLNRNVFELPEKLLTRLDPYLPSPTGKMPDRVNVVSQSLSPPAGLAGVHAFPKDLRAEHGFDNQANKLSLSPLLLDAFLRLSVSIVESPDFNPKTVGIWDEFFQPPPAGSDTEAEVHRRLKKFLRIAFRGPVDDSTRSRYVNYVIQKQRQGLSFTESMKKVASAVLCSPMFLYQSSDADSAASQYELATRLSLFLWASIPDAQLLDLAQRGELTKTEVMQQTLARMLADRKIERFLDTFPAQWMQLENLLAVTPDPQKNRYFSLDESYPASLQMVLEPLLLFDAVFIENRPVVELISPPFGYRSPFMRDWYESNFRPPQVDANQVTAKNQQLDERRKQLSSVISTAQAEVDSILNPVRERRIAAWKRLHGNQPVVDLKPYAAWDFNGDLKESLRGLDLTAHGKIALRDGMVVLNGAYLTSKPLPIELRAKTLEVWFQLADVNQRGGGVMGLQGPKDFDTIVLGERKPQHWISGSNGFSRTEDFPDSTAETSVDQPVHLAMVYTEDGTTTLYRNGVPYGKPYRKGAITFPQDKSSVLFGLRHLPPGGNKHLSVSIDRARLYDRALSAGEVAASFSGSSWYFSEQDLLAELSSPAQQQLTAANQKLAKAKAELAQVPPPFDMKAMQQEVQRQYDEQFRAKLRSSTFERVAISDPRYGGVITNAAVLSMTSGPQRTQPIARGAWVIEVIFNDPPPPPPNDVPPLKEDDTSHLTIREQFAAHRANPSCAGCHARIDPLGFALENFDITGRWRDQYDNGRKVDASGTLLRQYPFAGAVDFKASLVKEQERFARAFTAHLLRFALSSELSPADALTIDTIIEQSARDGFRLQSLLRGVVMSERFLQSR